MSEKLFWMKDTDNSKSIVIEYINNDDEGAVPEIHAFDDTMDHLGSREELEKAGIIFGPEIPIWDGESVK